MRRIRAGEYPLAEAYRAQTAAIYANAPVGKVVDHVVPLKGIDPVTKKHVVCGLHVPWNLCYMPGAENQKKWAWFK